MTTPNDQRPWTAKQALIFLSVLGAIVAVLLAICCLGGAWALDTVIADPVSF